MRSIAPAGARGDLGLDRDHVLQVAQRVARLLERDHLHEAADGRLARGDELLLRHLLLRRWRIPVSVATTNRCFGELRAKSTIPSVERICVRSFANAIAWLAQPHSGWTSSSASGASACQRSMSAGRMPGVDVALAEPDLQLAARSPARARGRGRGPAGRGSRGRPGSPRSRPARCPRCSSSRSRPSPRRSCSRTRRRRRRDAAPSSRAELLGVDRRGERAAGA